MSQFLKGRSIKEVVEEANKEVEDRRKGLKSKGIKTRWNNLNSYMGGGFQKGFNYLIAGLSGSGKSTLANIIETDIFDYNPDEPLMCLNFNFETPSIMNLIKKYSADVNMTVDQLMSVDKELPEETIVYMMWDGKGYYCGKHCLQDSDQSQWTTLSVESNYDSDQVVSRLRAREVTHLLIDTDLVEFILNHDPSGYHSSSYNFFNIDFGPRCTKKIKENGKVFLYELICP